MAEAGKGERWGIYRGKSGEGDATTASQVCMHEAKAIQHGQVALEYDTATAVIGSHSEALAANT